MGDLHLALSDQIEGMSGITLTKDVAAPGKAARLQPGGERLQLLLGKPAEQRRAGKQADAVGHLLSSARRAGRRPKSRLRRPAGYRRYRSAGPAPGESCRPGG